MKTIETYEYEDLTPEIQAKVLNSQIEREVKYRLKRLMMYEMTDEEWQ